MSVYMWLIRIQKINKKIKNLMFAARIWLGFEIIFWIIWFLEGVDSWISYIYPLAYLFNVFQPQYIRHMAMAQSKLFFVYSKCSFICSLQLRMFAETSCSVRCPTVICSWFVSNSFFDIILKWGAFNIIVLICWKVNYEFDINYFILILL